MNSDKEIVEIFHLFFLKFLEKRIEKSLYALKGGCNLRFYFKSIRYSEDMDLDIKTIAKETLRKNINKLLNENSFAQVLFSRGIEIVQITAPKQTETTQRWKIRLLNRNFSRELPTKIEFSRRKMEDNIIFEPIDSQITHQYKLQPILCSHYPKEVAVWQKINALISRNETQARDIFDLDLLSKLNIDVPVIKSMESLNIEKAKENSLLINFGDFKSQVFSYLQPEYQEYYNSEIVWNNMQENVLKILDTLNNETH